MIKFFTRVLSGYRSFKKPAAVVTAIMVVMQLVSMTRPWLFGRASDILLRAQAQNQDVVATMMSIIVISGGVWLSSLIGNALAAWRQKIEINKLDYDIDRFMDHRTLKRLMEFSPGQHQAENSGLKQSVVNKGKHALNTLAYSSVYEVAPVILECSILVVGLIWLNWAIGLVVILGLIAHVTAGIAANKPFVPKLKKYEKMWHVDSRLHGEVMRNLPLVQFSAQEERILAECDKSTEQLGDYAKAIWSAYRIKTALNNGVILGGVTAITVAVAGYAVATKACTPGEFVTLIWWSISPISRIEALTSVQRRILTMRTSIEEFWDMLAMEPDVVEHHSPIRPATILGKIEFQDVSFTYPSRKPVAKEGHGGDDEEAEPSGTEPLESISGITFTINPGERIAIVGPSGAGKSTIIKLLMRASNATGGRILVDGYDVRELALDRLRGAVGMVEQDVTLWDNTLRNNITFALDRHLREQITDQELDRIVGLCRIDEFMPRMEHGYDTIIGERGVQLSGGQRQRVGIARAIIKNPAILVLDEATNSLDSEKERDISEALEDVSRNRTTIIIAHRFSTIRNADRILVIEGGRLVDSGTHEQLVERCPLYSKLLKNQLHVTP